MKNRFLNLFLLNIKHNSSAWITNIEVIHTKVLCSNPGDNNAINTIVVSVDILNTPYTKPNDIIIIPILSIILFFVIYEITIEHIAVQIKFAITKLIFSNNEYKILSKIEHMAIAIIFLLDKSL